MNYFELTALRICQFLLKQELKRLTKSEVKTREQLDAERAETEAWLAELEKEQLDEYM